MFCNIPKAILEGMTCAEVNQLAAEYCAEADALVAWNNQRTEPKPTPPPWQVAAPPKSLDDYGRLRGR
jgi:hypothetical protein